jgi:hypothetical protein
MALVDRVVPPPTREERAKALELAIREATQHGITSVQDLGAAAGDLDLYDAARDAGTLSLRVYAAVPATHTPPEDFDAIAKRYPDDPLLKTGLAVVTLDGSVESQTAAMLEPYAPKGAGDGGVLALSSAELAKLVATLDGRGWQIAIEADGDRAVRAALDAYAGAVTHADGRRPARHRIEGITVVDPMDVPRFGALGVVASMQPRHALGGLASWSKAVGPDRIPFGWATRSLSAAGAHLAFGSEWPVLPLDPLDALRAVVRRPEIHAAEDLTLKSAINAWTSGAAWASFDDHRKGTLKPGMLADLVILSSDIFAGPKQLDAAEIVVTVFDGKVVYKRPS